MSTPTPSWPGGSGSGCRPPTSTATFRRGHFDTIVLNSVAPVLPRTADTRRRSSNRPSVCSRPVAPLSWATCAIRAVAADLRLRCADGACRGPERHGRDPPSRRAEPGPGEGTPRRPRVLQRPHPPSSRPGGHRHPAQARHRPQRTHPLPLPTPPSTRPASPPPPRRRPDPTLDPWTWVPSPITWAARGPTGCASPACPTHASRPTSPHSARSTPGRHRTSGTRPASIRRTCTAWARSTATGRRSAGAGTTRPPSTSRTSSAN